MVTTIGAASATTAATTTAISQSGSNSIKSDYASFLNLLTAQLKNQDPTKPADATQFVAQLAQFSSVEQQVNTNAKLDSLLAAYSANANSNQGLNTGGTLALLGKTVQAPMSTAKLTSAGGTLDIGYTSGNDTQANTIQIKDAGGTVVRTLSAALSPTGNTVTWNGLREDGSPAPAGNYTISLQEYQKNGVVTPSKVLLSSLVTGASTDTQGVATLSLANGDTVKVTDVRRVVDTSTANDATINAIAAYAKNISSTNDALLNKLLQQQVDTNNATIE
jgi:flagellar basal-body rod modification protein FlgD